MPDLQQVLQKVPPEILYALLQIILSSGLGPDELKAIVDMVAAAPKEQMVEVMQRLKQQIESGQGQQPQGGEQQYTPEQQQAYDQRQRERDNVYGQQ